MHDSLNMKIEENISRLLIVLSPFILYISLYFCSVSANVSTFWDQLICVNIDFMAFSSYA